MKKKDMEALQRMWDIVMALIDISCKEDVPLKELTVGFIDQYGKK